jgi:hypothetical protein
MRSKHVVQSEKEGILSHCLFLSPGELFYKSNKTLYYLILQGVFSVDHVVMCPEDIFIVST